MNEALNTSVNDANRRECFRINDRIGLTVRVLTEAEFKWARQRAMDTHTRQMAVNGMLMESDAQKSILRKLRNQQPLLVEYLESIETRLVTLARALQNETSDAPTTPTHDVNISGTGMRFRNHERLTKGTRLLLDMQLFPSRTCLRVVGTVAWAESQRKRSRQDGCAIAVDYSDIPEWDRELLIRHVHELQMDYVRRGVRRD